MKKLFKYLGELSSIGVVLTFPLLLVEASLYLFGAHNEELLHYSMNVSLGSILVYVASAVMFRLIVLSRMNNLSYFVKVRNIIFNCLLVAICLSFIALAILLKMNKYVQLISWISIVVVFVLAILLLYYDRKVYIIEKKGRN